MIKMMLRKMRVYALLCVLMCGSMGEKERLEDGFSEDTLADRLISVIEKRLQEYDQDLDGGSATSSHTCDFKIESNSIIKTHDSLDNGARFIANVENLHSREECQQHCCDSDTCNLAVFKEKEGNSCYLFDCGTVNKCNFTQHEDFSVMRLVGTALKEQVQAKHENDLAELVTKTPETTTATTTTTTTVQSTTTTTTTTTTTPEVSEKKAPVGLFGECENHQDCAGAGTECLAGYCVCQEGFHAQDGVCRKDCTRFEFECVNEGRPLAVPQCVAIYDACDKIQHCSDSSDEQNCAAITAKNKAMPVVVVGPVQPTPPVQQQQQQQYPNQQVVLPQQHQQVLPSGYVAEQSYRPFPQQYVDSSLLQQQQQGGYPQPDYSQQQLWLQQQQQLQQQQLQQQQLQQQQQAQQQLQQQQQPIPALQHVPQQQEKQLPILSKVQSPPASPSQPSPVGDLVQPERPISIDAASASRQKPFPLKSNGQQQVVPSTGGQGDVLDGDSKIPPRPKVQVQNPINSGNPSPIQPTDRNKEPVQVVSIGRDGARPGSHVVGPKKGGSQGQAWTQKGYRGPGNVNHAGEGGGHPPQQQGKVQLQGPGGVLPGRSGSRNRLQNSKASGGPVRGHRPGDGTAGRGKVNYSDGGYIIAKNPQQGHANNGGGVGGGGGNGNGNGQGRPNSMGMGRGGGGGGNMGNAYNRGYSNGYNPYQQSYPSYENQYYSQYVDPAVNQDFDYDYNFDPEGGFNGYHGRVQVPHWENQFQPNQQWNARPAQKAKGNSGESSSTSGAAVDTDGEMTEHIKDKSQDSSKPEVSNKDAEQSIENTIDQDDGFAKSSQKTDEPGDKIENHSDEVQAEKESSQIDGSEKSQNSKDVEEETPSDKSETQQQGNVSSDQSDSSKASSKESESDNAPDKADSEDTNKDGEDGNDSNDETDSEEEESSDDKADHAPSRMLVVVSEEQLSSAEEHSGSGLAQYNQGAVIALALGLAVTAMLLMFVGCRLRMVKRRLRRGRPLSTGEADYLINGMYL